MRSFGEIIIAGIIIGLLIVAAGELLVRCWPAIQMGLQQ